MLKSLMVMKWEEWIQVCLDNFCFYLFYEDRGEPRSFVIFHPFYNDVSNNPITDDVGFFHMQPDHVYEISELDNKQIYLDEAEYAHEFVYDTNACTNYTNKAL